VTGSSARGDDHGGAVWPWVVLALGFGLRQALAAATDAVSAHGAGLHGLSALAENLCAGRGFSVEAVAPRAPSTFRTSGLPSLHHARGSRDAALVGGPSRDHGAERPRLCGRRGSPPPGLEARPGRQGSPGGVRRPRPRSSRARTFGDGAFRDSLCRALAVAVLLWVLALQDGRPWSAVEVGVCVGAPALVRPIAVYFWATPVLSLLLGSAGCHTKTVLSATLAAMMARESVRRDKGRPVPGSGTSD
jgi:hypothetical protein